MDPSKSIAVDPLGIYAADTLNNSIPSPTKGGPSHSLCQSGPDLPDLWDNVPRARCVCMTICGPPLKIRPSGSHAVETRNNLEPKEPRGPHGLLDSLFLEPGTAPRYPGFHPFDYCSSRGRHGTRRLENPTSALHDTYTRLALGMTGL